ncbi:hypothetical protein OQA88_12007 [Cercophora sp. LCS_1]
MSQAEDNVDTSEPRRFALIAEEPRPNDAVNQEESPPQDASSQKPSQEPDHEAAAHSHEPHEENPSDPDVQRKADEQHDSAGFGDDSFTTLEDIEPDNFLHPQEVIQAREAIQIRHGRCANCLNKLVIQIDEKDAAARYREEEAANDLPAHNTKPTNDSQSPFASQPYSDSGTEDDDEPEIVAWEEKDPENPYNWPGRKKKGIVLITMMLIINSTMGSALPSNALPFIATEWHVESEQQKVLPISVYLIGYILGPILWAPLSEQFGRRRLTIATFAMFTLFTMACALSPDWPVFLVFRLFTGIFASAPIAIVPGIIADTHGDPRSRGRSMGLFFATTLMGPLLAPIVSGYAAPTIGWRWSFWIGLIYAGLTMFALAFLPETFGPVLLLRRARSVRKLDPTAHVVAPHELERKSLKELTTVVLTRPIRMIITEPIVNTSCAYLALCYAIFYMSFEAYPIIFIDLYDLSPGECGLTYLGIAVGCVLALPIFFLYDNILRRAQSLNKPWTRLEESRRLPLACIGGPLFVASLFWLGWTSTAQIHFIIPLLAGIPFGIGFMCIFQALLNYLTDAYEIFAASANAAASCSRSLLATVLPLATQPMFARLGIAGACSLLGGVATLMCVVPFVFLWQGQRIRANSKFCIALREQKEEMERKIEQQRRRRTLRQSVANGMGTGGRLSGASTPVNGSGFAGGSEASIVKPQEV